MKISFGDSRFNLVISSPKIDSEETYEDVVFQSGQAWQPDRFGPEYMEGLEARRASDSSFIGKIGIDGFNLIDLGFEADGIACSEDGEADYSVGRQQWYATRRPEQA